MKVIYEKNIVNTDNDGEDISINSCGYINFCSDSRTLREKGSPNHLILYIANGKGYFEINNEITVVNASSFIYFPPNARQNYYYKASDNARVYFCHFGGDKIKSLFEDSGIAPITVYNTSSGDILTNCFERIIKEYTLKENLYNKIAQNQIVEILAAISRGTPENINNTKTPVHNALIDINKRCEQNRTINEYAQMCNLSKYHFIRLFKKHTGLSPIEYRNKIRISLAKEYLNVTSMSISEVAEMVGFSSSSYFCRIYKKNTGKTPKCK